GRALRLHRGRRLLRQRRERLRQRGLRRGRVPRAGELSGADPLPLSATRFARAAAGARAPKRSTPEVSLPGSLGVHPGPWRRRNARWALLDGALRRWDTALRCGAEMRRRGSAVVAAAHRLDIAHLGAKQADRRVADHALSSELRLMLEVARERRAGALADLPVDLPAVEAEQLEPLLHLSRLLLAQGLQLHVGSAVFQRGLR